MTDKTTCTLCGLPFKVAISALPFVTGAAAGLVTGCSGDDCPPARRILHGVLAAGLTAAVTVGLELLAQEVCQCTEGSCT